MEISLIDMPIKIAVAVVSNRLIKPKTTLALMEMIAHTKHEVFPIVASEGYTTAEGRNYCVIQAMRNNCTHLLFVDDDMTFPVDTIERLLAHGKELVGVYSYSRALPLSPTVAFLDEEGNHLPHDRIAKYKKPKELFKCFAIGMGVALIDMNLFAKIDKPWFKFDVHESGKIIMGEDAWLCKQSHEKGIDVWCDPTLKIGHLGDFDYGEHGAKRLEHYG